MSITNIIYVLNCDSVADFPLIGSIVTLYIDDSNNLIYRWDGSSYVVIGQYPSVPTYADLPPAADNNGKVYLVTTSTGIYPFNHPAGFYVSNGVTWTYIGLTGTVQEVIGTTNQIDVANGTTTPTISISSTLVLPGTVTISVLTASSLVYTNASKALASVTLGTGLSLVTGTLSVTGVTPGQLALNSGQIIVGNVSNVGAAVTMSGDITINNTGVSAIGANKVLDTMIRQSVGLSVIGRSANTTGNVADITAASDFQVLGRSGTSIAFGSVNLASANAITGTLPQGNGGTGFSTYTLGDILYSSATNTLSKLAGNITTAKQYLSQTGDGAASAAPAWATVSGGDITGAALTKVDDTNVTLTLGGTPATALLRAASLTLGWTGLLSIARGGNNIGSQTTNGVLFNNGTANTTSANLTYNSSTSLLTSPLLLLGSGNTTLRFGNGIVQRKIELYRDTDNDHQFYGFGINNSVLRYQTSASASDHVFYSGINSSSSLEVFRVKGTGVINIPGLTASYAVVTDASKNLASLQYTSSSTANTLVLRDANGNFRIPLTNIVYVATNGSDSTGNGSVTAPYATISFAFSQITTASITNPYAIYLFGGNYSDAFNIKPNISIIGNGSLITATSNITAGAGFLTSGASYSFMTDVTLAMGAFSFNFDISANIGGSSTIFMFDNVNSDGNNDVTLNITGKSIGPFLLMFILRNCFWDLDNGSNRILNVTNASSRIINSRLQTATIISSASSGIASCEISDGLISTLTLRATGSQALNTTINMAIMPGTWTIDGVHSIVKTYQGYDTAPTLVNSAVFGPTVLYGGIVKIGPSQTITVDHKLVLTGTDSNISGPHFGAYTASDQYPLFQNLNWSHNDISLSFDAYYNGSNWKSSTSSANYQIRKVSSQCQFNYASGVAAGSNITWTTAGYIDTSGNLKWQNPVNIGASQSIALAQNLVLTGTDSSASLGPNYAAYTAADLYPLFQNFNYAHNNVSLCFDCYLDGSNFRSSHSGSNYAIRKVSNQLQFIYDSGVPAGSVATQNIAGYLNTSGYLTWNKRIGIGITPTDILHIEGSGTAIRVSDGAIVGRFFAASSTGNVYLAGSSASATLILRSADTDRIFIDTSANFGINGASFGSGAGVMFMANATTVPTTNPTGGGILYVTGGALKYRGSSGTVTNLANA